ncbi:TMV resistance protein N-like [Neltuma alba]|uniref:TMV resistance protein N-like n=1 Tax=Neltuma alba TaxID=207710 RepID=UPI0010A56681|nr:TMV resistance protein N-like [Prosopis alba]
MALYNHGVEYSSSFSGSNRRHKYDVFLSFRGEDTRECFTDHLYAALCRNELITFRDEEELERGEVINLSLLQAIEESLCAIVVLSENYASSRWCLDELLKILHSKKELGLHIFPIFYGIDPSDVRHQRGRFKKAFEELEQKFAHDKVCKWRDALKEVADISGWNSRYYRYESKLIENVAEILRSKLDDQRSFNSNDEGVVKTHLNDDRLVGIDAKIAEFDSFLANTSEGVQFIGIWGMGGLGKTTLARAVYKRIKKNYEVHFFLHNIREKSAQNGGLIELQKELLSHPKRRTRTEVGNSYDGRELIGRKLRNTKVLLVLDDVSDINQLENLAGKKGWFGKGSRIIITTRDKHLLVQYGVSQYKMNFLSQDESRQLFLQKAFKGDHPNGDYLELSKILIKSTKGLPLALKVFGSFLCGRSKSEWEDTLSKVPPNDILEILQVSFDGLEYNEKTIFLDIACFFNGEAKDNVIQILENCGLHPRIGIPVLIEKSLLTEFEGCLWVHDMLREMGKKIVFLESPNDAGKRSRIWSLEDANHVLGNKRGTEAIYGIVVRFDKPYAMHFNPEAFSSMSNLKLLMISSHSHSRMQLNLLRGLNCLSTTLKVIEWEGYPLDFLPSQTQLNELVDLRMQHSKLKELWTGTQFLQSLKFIDLSHSTNLIRTPNFDGTPNLQRLILEGCTKLVEVHYSLGQHKKLVIVDFKGCKSIKTLPTKIEMNCLELFILSGCSKIKKLPEFGKGMEHLSLLDLEETAISKLPQSFVNLIGLAILNLANCKNLVCLPSDFQKLKAIKNINISGCPKFSRLPENLNENEALEDLDVSGTALKEVPSSLRNLRVLSLSRCSGYSQSSSSSSSWDLYSLPKRAFRLQRPSTMFSGSPFSNLSSLVTLHLSYCNLHDESLSNEISSLSSLTALDLSGNNFVEFPSGLISKLRKLESIGLNNCPRLQSLPQLPKNLSIIQAGDCPSLKHYACSQQLWEFIEHFESQTRLRRSEISGHDWKCHFLSDYVSAIVTWDSEFSDFFMQPTRLLTIPGNEVPSWFHNQSYYCAKDFPYEYTPTNVSFTIELPDSCRSSEWWGIAVCLVLEHDLEAAEFDDAGVLCWTYRVSEDEYSNSFRCCSICVQSSCRHQRCIIYIRSSSFVVEQPLQMVFFIYNKGEQKKSIFKIEQCGWRVLCKEDVERWRNTRDEGYSSTNNDQFIVEEDESITSAEPIASRSDQRELRLCLNILWPIMLFLFIMFISIVFIIEIIGYIIYRPSYFF